MKRKKRKSRSFVNIICLIMLGASIYFVYTSFQSLQTTVELKQSISEKQQTKSDLAAKKKELNETKQNLTNPDYVEYIARGKYLVTKDGEQVFTFPSKDTDD